MKKLVLASILVASALFAADVSADAKAFGKEAFDNAVKAGKFEKQAQETRDEFRAKMKSKLDSLNDEEKRAFMQEFRADFDSRVDKLSVKEAKELGFKIGGKDARGAYMGGGHHHMMGKDKMGGCGCDGHAHNGGNMHGGCMHDKMHGQNSAKQSAPKQN